MTEQEKLEHVAGDNPEATVGDGVSFIKVRRITGYLVGDVRKRFNNAKQVNSWIALLMYLTNDPGVNSITLGINFTD